MVFEILESLLDLGEVRSAYASELDLGDLRPAHGLVSRASHLLAGSDGSVPLANEESEFMADEDDTSNDDGTGDP